MAESDSECAREKRQNSKLFIHHTAGLKNSLFMRRSARKTERRSARKIESTNQKAPVSVQSAGQCACASQCAGLSIIHL